MPREAPHFWYLNYWRCFRKPMGQGFPAFAVHDGAGTPHLNDEELISIYPISATEKFQHMGRWKIMKGNRPGVCIWEGIKGERFPY